MGEYVKEPHNMYVDTFVQIMRDLHVAVCLAHDPDTRDKAAERYIVTLMLLYQCATGTTMPPQYVQQIMVDDVTADERRAAIGT